MKSAVQSKNKKQGAWELGQVFMNFLGDVAVCSSAAIGVGWAFPKEPGRILAPFGLALGLCQLIRGSEQGLRVGDRITK
jgi:hypothetical protein